MTDEEPTVTTLPRHRPDAPAVVNERSRIAAAVRKVPKQGWTHGDHLVSLRRVLDIIEKQP